MMLLFDRVICFKSMWFFSFASMVARASSFDSQLIILIRSWSDDFEPKFKGSPVKVGPRDGGEWNVADVGVRTMRDVMTFSIFPVNER